MTAELRSGYRQTELGIVPEDWLIQSLPEALHFISGKAHEQSINEAGPYIVVNSKFISTAGNVKKYSSENFCPAKRGDILMVMSDLPNGRALAKCYLVKEDKTYAVNQRVCIFRPKKGVSEYFYYFLNRNKYFMQFDDGVQQTHLLNPMILSCPLKLPPEPEQYRIGQMLVDIDSLISSLDQLVTKKRDLKQASMQQLLTGQRRLPGFSGEWAVRQLRDVLSVRYGRNQNEIESVDGAYPILGTGGEIGRTDVPLYEKPSVLIGRKGTIDRPMYRDTPFWTVDTLFYTELSNKAVAKFIYYRFLIINWYSHNEASGVPSLNATTIENIEIYLPDVTEQIAIANILSDMDAELSTLESRRDKVHQIKQGMMHELLTGRVRLIHGNSE